MTDRARPKIDFSDALRLAAGEAKRQEDYAQESQQWLLGKLALKAAENPQFRNEFRSHPERVVEREAKSANVPVTPDMLTAARKVLSAAIPGADAEKVQVLVFTTIEDIRRSFKMTLQLSTWLFAAGLVMITIAFLSALQSDRVWAVGVAGGSGALSLLLSAVMNPLDRIRNAAGNLAQIQAAYLGFYKQLFMLGVAVEDLSREDAITYSEQIQAAAKAAVDSISSALHDLRSEHIPKKESSRKNAGRRKPNVPKPKELVAAQETIKVHRKSAD